MADYAATLGDLGRYSDMLRVVRQLAEFAPDYPQVHYLQAVLAARAEDPVLASNLLNRSGLAAQGVPTAMMLDAIVDLQQGNFDTASETLENLAMRQPGNMRLKELLARALWLGRRDKELINRFAVSALQREASPYLVMLVGRALERSGDRKRAIPYLNRALEERQAIGFVLAGSGQGSGAMPAATTELRDFTGSGNLGPARRLTGALLSRSPHSTDFHALAGDVALAGGNAGRALELYEVAARVRRSWPLTRKIFEAYRTSGDELAAHVLLARYVAGDPQNTDALLLLAKRSAEREDWLRVVVLLDTAIGLGAGNDLEVLALREQAARSLGRDDDADKFDDLRAKLLPGEFL